MRCINAASIFPEYIRNEDKVPLFRLPGSSTICVTKDKSVFSDSHKCVWVYVCECVLVFVRLPVAIVCHLSVWQHFLTQCFSFVLCIFHLRRIHGNHFRWIQRQHTYPSPEEQPKSWAINVSTIRPASTTTSTPSVSRSGTTPSVSVGPVSTPLATQSQPNVSSAHKVSISGVLHQIGFFLNIFYWINVWG